MPAARWLISCVFPATQSRETRLAALANEPIFWGSPPPPPNRSVSDRRRRMAISPEQGKTRTESSRHDQTDTLNPSRCRRKRPSPERPTQVEGRNAPQERPDHTKASRNVNHFFACHFTLPLKALVLGPGSTIISQGRGSSRPSSRLPLDGPGRKEWG